MSERLVGLYGSGHGDKEGLLGVLDYLGPTAETRFGCPSGVLDYLGPALLTGKGCLLGMLDYLGPAAETVLVSVGRIGLFGSGRVDRQGVSPERVGLFGSGY